MRPALVGAVRGCGARRISFHRIASRTSVASHRTPQRFGVDLLNAQPPKDRPHMLFRLRYVIPPGRRLELDDIEPRVEQLVD
jgi:hypothetical protein